MGNSDQSGDASGGGNSSGGDPSTRIFTEGEKVLAYHGPRIYEAKAGSRFYFLRVPFFCCLLWRVAKFCFRFWAVLIDSCYLNVSRSVGETEGKLQDLVLEARQFYRVQKTEVRKKEWKYFVHYLVSGASLLTFWDEWVAADRLLKHTEENIMKQETLEKKQGIDKNPKSGRLIQYKLKNAADAKVEREDFKSLATKGKKRKSDAVAESENAILEKFVKIQIPLTLKKQLVDDWEFVTQQDKLVKLPRSPTVDNILTSYLDYKSKKDVMIIDSIGEVLKGLRCYFDKALPAMLLYKKERQQYKEAVAPTESPSTIYGAEHLLRLFVKLPELLAQVNIEEETLTRLQQKLVDFLKFLQKNQSTFFISAYEGSKVSDGKSKRKDDKD
ncbi:hypothetical protein SAY87_008436 [Trapa incisa]|uniref:MRG domain-containing protein n=1 Tax=Trapa incisa TaxID=236973 RepID=A0AAN7KG30_9MYRT|nr:hypothetical protein SAY87_008436 [Trapa incisa]